MLFVSLIPPYITIHNGQNHTFSYSFYQKLFRLSRNFLHFETDVSFAACSDTILYWIPNATFWQKNIFL